MGLRSKFYTYWCWTYYLDNNRINASMVQVVGRTSSYFFAVIWRIDIQNSLKELRDCPIWKEKRQ